MVVVVARLVMCSLLAMLSAGGGRLGRQSGCLVVVELGEVVGHHVQSSLGAGFDPASSEESGDALVVLGVAEHRLDGLASFSVSLAAVL